MARWTGERTVGKERMGEPWTILLFFFFLTELTVKKKEKKKIRRWRAIE
jgi:hypothetical protein